MPATTGSLPPSSLFSASLRALLLPGALALAAALSAAPLAVERGRSAGDGVGWFVPEGGIDGTLPSLALVAEPADEGPLPADWELVPEYAAENGVTRAVFTLPEDMDLYGTGEVTGPLRRNGERIVLWNTDNFAYTKADGERLYQSHPWVLGLRPDGSAFGLIFDTTWKSTLETRDDAVIVESEGPPFRVLVIDRDSPQAVLRGLAELTGFMPLPPRWMVIDYMDGFRVFTFDPERFPDPAATNTYLHDQGFKAIWMIDPGVKQDPGYFVYDSGTERDVWVETAEGDPFVGEVWPGGVG